MPAPRNKAEAEDDDQGNESSSEEEESSEDQPVEEAGRGLKPKAKAGPEVSISPEKDAVQVGGEGVSRPRPASRTCGASQAPAGRPQAGPQRGERRPWQGPTPPQGGRAQPRPRREETRRPEPLSLREFDPLNKPLPHRRRRKEELGREPKEGRGEPAEDPKPDKFKCRDCWRMIEDHAAARRQHRLGVHHRTWKYFGQGVNWTDAVSHAKSRFQEHWRADFDGHPEPSQARMTMPETRPFPDLKDKKKKKKKDEKRQPNAACGPHA